MTIVDGMLSVDEAQRRLGELVGRLAVVEVALADATGMVLADDVVAGRDLPGFDNSAMDGFALRSAETTGASAGRPARLRVVGEIAAGSGGGEPLAPGTAVRIMTGAPIPPGADAVLEVEETRLEGDEVLALRAAEVGRSRRAAGSDIRGGETALRAGAHLGSAQVALLAALGASRLRVFQRPRVALLATGDELVDVEVDPGPGQVVDAATPGLRAAVLAMGAEAVVIARARDSVEDLRRALALAAEADLIVSVGGVSMGEYDLVREVVADMGELDFWTVRMRPGKPLAVGSVRGTPFIGLPGNPVSALVGCEVYVLPAVLTMSGRDGWARPRGTARLTAALRTPSSLRTFARAIVRAGANGLEATPLPGQGSHQVRSLADANALLDIPEEVADLTAGTKVTALLVDQPPSPPL